MHSTVNCSVAFRRWSVGLAGAGPKLPEIPAPSGGPREGASVAPALSHLCLMLGARGFADKGFQGLQFNIAHDCMLSRNGHGGGLGGQGLVGSSCATASCTCAKARTTW